MKKNRFKILTVACVVGANLIFSSCVDNLLNQTPGGISTIGESLNSQLSAFIGWY